LHFKEILKNVHEISTPGMLFLSSLEELTQGLFPNRSEDLIKSGSLTHDFCF
jgi:hypothetical protein